MTKNENIIIIVLLVIVVGIIAYVALKPKPTPAQPSGLSVLLGNIGAWFSGLSGTTPAQALAAIPGGYNANTNTDSSTSGLPALPTDTSIADLPPLPAN